MTSGTPGTPWAIPKTPCIPLDHPQNTWNPLLGHPQDAWDPLGTPRSLLGCLGPPLHHSRDVWEPLWITPRISGSPLRCLSLLGGTFGGAPRAFTAQGAASQQPWCRLPRGHRRRGALLPCKNAPDVNSAGRVLYRAGGAGGGWLRPPHPRPLPLYTYFCGFPSFWPFSVYKLVRTVRATGRDLCPLCDFFVKIRGLYPAGLGTAGTLETGKNGILELGQPEHRGGVTARGNKQDTGAGTARLGTVRAGDWSW